MYKRLLVNVIILEIFSRMQLAKLRILQYEKKFMEWKHDKLYPHDKQSASRKSSFHEMQLIQKSPTIATIALSTKGNNLWQRLRVITHLLA